MDTGGGFLFTIVLASSISVLFAETPDVARKKRNLFPLIGYLQGYKMGQNLALQLSPLVLSPVVVIPINREQSVHLHGTYDENNIENIHYITPSEKLTKHCNSSDTEPHENRDNETITLERNVELLNEEDTFRQSVINETVTEANVRGNNTTTATDVNQNMTTVIIKTERDENTTKSFGPYPAAVYKNDKVATLTITEIPNDSDFMLPSVDDNWQNFTSKDTTESQVESRAGAGWSGDSKPDYTRYSTSYVNNYYNGMKAYTDSYERRPTYGSERWSTSYSGHDSKLISEFRPLAGLYYDGYLHKAPVKKQGFVPYQHYYQ